MSFCRVAFPINWTALVLTNSHYQTGSMHDANKITLTSNRAVMKKKKLQNIFQAISTARTLTILGQKSNVVLVQLRITLVPTPFNSHH